MHIIIAGSRTLEVKDYSFVKETLTNIIAKEQYMREIPNKELEIVSGNASTGADHLGENFAKKNNLALKLFPADWNDMSPPCIVGNNYYGEYNKMAGTKRNQQMADYLVEKGTGIWIAFDAEEKNPKTGTKDMIRISKKAGIKTYHVKCENREKLKIKVYNGDDNGS